MNIFFREMKANRKGLICWIVGMAFTILASMGKYVATSETGSLNEIMSKMPKSMQAIMGTNDFDLTTIGGYYGILFLYILLIATVHSAMLGSSIILKEERDKTTEFLLVKPVSRNRIITSKLLAALANILLLNIITLIISIVSVNKYGKGEDITSDIIILMGGMFILQIIFMSIGSAIAAAIKKNKIATSLSTAVLLIMFIISIAIDINTKIDWLRYITPFKYFEAKNLMNGGGFDIVYLLLSFGIVTILIAITYVFYNRRDISN